MESLGRADTAGPRPSRFTGLRFFFLGLAAPPALGLIRLGSFFFGGLFLRGRPRKDDRKMLKGMLWIAHSGAQWRELPEVYGPWQSVYARFAKWRNDGTLEAVFRALSADADMENLSLDSTCIKVYESANGGKIGG